ncbi:MAG TPA: hypothetical protein PKY59_11990 [Pyrinomonadaceae bacterium]|nr:hypothetical protein [Pyrinomonadaceae bacterium]
MTLTNKMNNSEENLLNQIVHLMQTDKSVDAPQDSIKWAKNIFRSRMVEPKKSFVQKVLAVLQMDISPNKAVFGERSASASQARQMLFEAGENGIDLRITETENGFDLRGQILGEGFANSVIKIGETETTTNDLSEFVFANIESGIYDLTLKNGETEIVIENLELK